MIRKIIQIDTEKCNGCGLCAAACHEGAIGMVNGKAVLLRDDYCDGLGDCLPTCPADAISFVEREAAAYDHAAVQAAKAQRTAEKSAASPIESALVNWPIQLKLVSPRTSRLNHADLLIAADCTAFACTNLHTDFMPGRAVLIGCPKLDAVDYAEKLALILMSNDIRSITVLRMEVPCCGGLTGAVQRALQASGKNIPLSVRIVSTDGKILSASNT